MGNIRRHKFIAFALSLFLLVFLVLPNVFNSREEAAFSAEHRLELARKTYHVDNVSDSVEVVPGDFYNRGAIVQALLGTAYRDLWQRKIKVPVLRLREAGGGLMPFAFSGSQQTIGIKVRDTSGRVWSIRSVNKDQIGALPQILHSTILRPMFRDQACSLNPYGALPLIKLAPAIGAHCDTPLLCFFPYDPSLGKYNDRMAGRLVMLTKARESYLLKDSADSVKAFSSEEMMALVKQGTASVDTSLYLRTRLLDMLISDWDRHAGNWKWIGKESRGKTILEPVATDRDMAFYRFGGGFVNQITLLFVKTFQSFTPKYKSVDGLMIQAAELDRFLLARTNRERFIYEARFIQARLNEGLIKESLLTYPPAAYSLAGADHEKILKERLKSLHLVAQEFHDLLQENKK